jgi:hypothetical protein
MLVHRSLSLELCGLTGLTSKYIGYQGLRGPVPRPLEGHPLEGHRLSFPFLSQYGLEIPPPALDGKLMLLTVQLLYLITCQRSQCLSQPAALEVPSDA